MRDIHNYTLTTQNGNVNKSSINNDYSVLEGNGQWSWMNKKIMQKLFLYGFWNASNCFSQDHMGIFHPGHIQGMQMAHGGDINKISKAESCSMRCEKSPLSAAAVNWELIYLPPLYLSLLKFRCSSTSAKPYSITQPEMICNIISLEWQCFPSHFITLFWMQPFNLQ